MKSNVGSHVSFILACVCVCTAGSSETYEATEVVTALSRSFTNYPSLAITFGGSTELEYVNFERLQSARYRNSITISETELFYEEGIRWHVRISYKYKRNRTDSQPAIPGKGWQYYWNDNDLQAFQTRGKGEYAFFNIPKPPLSHSSLHIYPDTLEAGDFHARLPAKELFGYLGSDPIPIYEVMQNADELRISEREELIDGHSCVHAKAIGEFGTYDLWLDPEYGFLPRKVIIKKEGEDILGSKKVNEWGINMTGTDAMGMVTKSSERSWSAYNSVVIEMDNVEISEHDGYFFLVSVKVKEIQLWDNGLQQILTRHAEMEQTLLNPDFSALGAFDFESSIPDGTWVWIVGSATGYGALEWRQGKIIPRIREGERRAIEP